MSNREIKQKRKAFLKEFYRGNRTTFVLAIMATMLTSVGMLFIAWLLQQILDTAAGTEGAMSLTTLLILTIVLIVGNIALGTLQAYVRPRFVTKATRQYKDYAFKELSKKGISAFNRENTTSYISALSNDVTAIEKNHVSVVFSLIHSVIGFVGAFALMMFYNPLLTLVAIGISIIPAIASILTGNRLAVAEKEVSDRNEGYLATLKDCLTGFSVIKSFKAEAQMFRVIADANKTLEKAKCRRERTDWIIQTIAMTAGNLAQFGVFLVGTYFVLSGKGITVGALLAFVQLMNYVIAPIGEIPSLLAKRKAATALVDKLVEAVHSNTKKEGKIAPKTLTEGIQVKDVSFAYEEGKYALRNVSAEFELGKSYAIVGASGSGKSTLLNLLMAGYDNYEGDICFDSTELRDMDTDALYGMMSIVQQNVFVFNHSIRDNITMFHEFEQEEVDRAIELSGLNKLIAERGADYTCGENGSGLSGGERQRISIARCLLRKTPVLLVDEATAALDAETAFYVTNSILDITGLTRIVVTHALDETLLKKYDNILTLKNGSVIESGTYEELMEKKGYFYSLFTVSQT